MEGRKLTTKQTSRFKLSASPNPLVPGAYTAALLAAAADRQGIKTGRISVKNYDQQQKIDADAKYIDSFPSGVRFRPTNEELIVHYLARKVNKQPLPPNKMVEADLYMHHPQFLSETYKPVVENTWYFFTSRDRKYPKGSRPNRRADEGFWKATGADKSIKSTSNGGAVIIGFKKSLVYYEGKPPKGDRKTEWIMHEFRVNGPPRKRKDDNDMKLDEWVLCRLYKKGGKITRKKQEGLQEEKEQNSSSVTTSDTADKEANLDCPSIPLHFPPEDANIHGGYYAQLSDFPPRFNLPHTPPQFWGIGCKPDMRGGGSVHHFVADSSVGSRYQSVNPWDFNPRGFHVQGSCEEKTNYFNDPFCLSNNSGPVDCSGGYTTQFVRMDQILPAAHYQPINNPDNISNIYSRGTNVGNIVPGYNQLANTAAATDLIASHPSSATPVAANMGEIMPSHNQLANNATATNYTAGHPSSLQ